MKQLPYDCKFSWVSRSLEDELKRISEDIKIKRGFLIEKSTLSHQLALDIREGNVYFDPIIMRFKKRNVIKLGNNFIQIKKAEQPQNDEPTK